MRIQDFIKIQNYQFLATYLKFLATTKSFDPAVYS